MPPDVKELRRLVGGLRARGFLPYGRSFDYARKASEVLDALDTVAGTHPGEAGPLYRSAIQNITRTTEQADDSSGSVGDVLRRAVGRYAGVCRAATPDRVKLAIWLVDFQVDGPGWPDIPVADFAEALGSEGLAAYRRRLTERAGDPTVRHLWEEYHRTVSHDTDALIELYADELPLGYRYWQIGDTLRGAGRREEAIAWLRRGLAETDRPDSRIDELLAEVLGEVGSFGEAADVRWKLFAEQPDPQRHRALLDAAERAGSLAEMAERADAYLHERAARGGYQADPLVDVLLSSGDADAAWEAGIRYRSSDAMMWRLAATRAKTHPADAIPVFVAQVGREIERKNKKAYAEAARLMLSLQDLHERARRDGFADYVAAVKQEHRLRPSFLAALTKAGL